MRRLSLAFSVLAGGLYLCVNPALGQRGMGRGGQAPGAGMPPRAQGPSQRSAQAGAKTAAQAQTGDPASIRTQTQVATQLERNPNLSSRLTALLPSGVTLHDAATGFKNQGQFIAALHVSQNLGIPFPDLKSRMTGENPVSLGKAIQELRPEMPPDQVRTTAREAETQAKQDVREARNTVQPTP